MNKNLNPIYLLELKTINKETIAKTANPIHRKIMRALRRRKKSGKEFAKRVERDIVGYIPQEQPLKHGWHKRAITILNPDEKTSRIASIGAGAKKQSRKLSNSKSGRTTKLDETISKRKPGTFKRLADDKKSEDYF